MSADVDYYDVRRIVEEEASRLRGRIDDAVDDLLKRVGALEREVESLERVLHSRTDHLV